MIWPSSSPHIFSLPQLPKDETQSHLDPIIDICANDKQLPYAVITTRSIYLFNSKTNTIINAHVRSVESIETYGENCNIKRSSNGVNFIIQSSKNYLLVYSILDLEKTSSIDEIMTIYDKQKSNKLLQNGFPVVSANDQNVKSFLSNLFSKNGYEYPNHDLGLRFKIVLKIQSELIDFITLPNNQLLLLTKDPKALQLIQLGDSHNNSNIEVTLIDELDWYEQDRSAIRKVQYEPITKTLYWLNEKNCIWSIKVNSQVAVTGFQGTLIYNGDDSIDNFIVNQNYNLITYITTDGDMMINKLKDQKKIELVSINRKSAINKSTKLLDLKISPCNSCLLLLFDKGWCIFSVFGNLNFSTFDFIEEQDKIPDYKNWLTSLTKFDWSSNNELVFTNQQKIFIFKLLRTNHTLQQNSATLKRPILYNNDYISIFKGYEKPLNDYSSHSEVLNNKESELWYHVQLPTNFKLKNDRITSITASDDGMSVCCVGNKDLIIYNHLSGRWKFLINDNNNSMMGEYDKSSNNNILQSLWFENHLILAIRADEKSAFNDMNDEDDLKPTTEILIFSNLIWNDDVEFNPELCIWSYSFNNQDLVNKKGEILPRMKPKEDFLYFNIDKNELIVLTTEINCYFFQITKLLKKKKSTVQLKCNKVFSLKRFFQSQNKLKFSPSSIKSINKINENDLLILVNGEVIYLRQSLLEEDIASSVTTSTAELARIKSSASLSSLHRNVSGVDIPSTPKQETHTPPVTPRGQLSSPQVNRMPSQSSAATKKRPSIRFEKIILASGVEYLYKLNSHSITMFNGNEMIYYDSNIFANARLAKFNISKVEPLFVNLDNENSYVIKKRHALAEVNIVTQNNSNIYPFVTILDQNVIIGFEVDLKLQGKNGEWFNIMRKSIRRDFLSNLLDYYLKISDLDSFKIYTEYDIFQRFSHFKNYQFCLEILMLNYLTSDVENEIFFKKLINLIRISSTSQSSEYVIYLSLLKKIEVNYWLKFFKELGQTPREILMDKVIPSKDYKLGCHYFILAMNYEKQIHDSKILDVKDQDLILTILTKLIEDEEYDICFELIRYIKFMDQEDNLKLIDQFLRKNEIQ